jgi:hypothetical protein
MATRSLPQAVFSLAIGQAGCVPAFNPVIGHTEQWDDILIGDFASHHPIISFRLAGRTLVVVRVGRDHTGLEAEASLEYHAPTTIDTAPSERPSC